MHSVLVLKNVLFIIFSLNFCSALGRPQAPPQQALPQNPQPGQDPNAQQQPGIPNNQPTLPNNQASPQGDPNQQLPPADPNNQPTLPPMTLPPVQPAQAVTQAPPGPAAVTP